MRPKTIFTIFILLLTVFYSGTLSAQRLVIWQKNGTKVSFDLDEQPKTTFTTEDLVITTATATISYPLGKIQRYTYESGEVNVRDVKSKGICIWHDGDNIIIKGLPKGKSVTVYSIDGKQLLTKPSAGSERLTLSLSDLPAGAYVVKADEITYKFSKR